MTFPESSQSILAKLHIAHLDKHTLLGLVLLSIAILVALLLGVVSILDADTHKAYGIDEASRQESIVEQTQDAAEGAQVSAEKVYVHVAGAVSDPGMYALDAGSRVDDAISAAGGFTDDANDKSVNLARKLEDGEQLIVPSEKEVASAAEATEDTSEDVAVESSSSSGGKVNINTAGVEELTNLKGVGEATAQKIISERETNGSFKSASDITRVSGIGEKKYEAMKDDITV